MGCNGQTAVSEGAWADVMVLVGGFSLQFNHYCGADKLLWKAANPVMLSRRSIVNVALPTYADSEWIPQA